MNRTRLSSKGQVVLPKAVRDALRLEDGAEFIVTIAGNAVVLSRVAPFVTSTLDDVYGCLRHAGSPKSLDDMEAGIRRAVARRAGAALPAARRRRPGP